MGWTLTKALSDCLCRWAVLRLAPNCCLSSESIQSCMKLAEEVSRKNPSRDAVFPCWVSQGKCRDFGWISWGTAEVCDLGADEFGTLFDGRRLGSEWAPLRRT